MTSKKINFGESHKFTSRAANNDFTELTPITLLPGVDENLNADNLIAREIFQDTSTSQIYGTILPMSSTSYFISSPTTQKFRGISVSVSKHTTDYNYFCVGAPKLSSSGGCIGVQGTGIGSGTTTEFDNIQTSIPATYLPPGNFIEAGVYSAIGDSGIFIGFSHGRNYVGYEDYTEIYKLVGGIWTFFQTALPITYMNISNNMMIGSDIARNVYVFGLSENTFSVSQQLTNFSGSLEVTNERLRIDNDNTIAFLHDYYLSVYTIGVDGVWVRDLYVDTSPYSMFRLDLQNNMIVLSALYRTWVYERPSFGFPFVRTLDFQSLHVINALACNDFSFYTLTQTDGLRQYIKIDGVWDTTNPTFYSAPDYYHMGANNKFVIIGNPDYLSNNGLFTIIHSNFYQNSVSRLDNIIISQNTGNISFTADDIVINSDTITYTPGSRGPAVEFYNILGGTAQAIPHNTFTALGTAFTSPTVLTNTGSYSTLFDTNGYFNLVIPKTGYYDFVSQFAMQALATGYIIASLHVNGQEEYAYSSNVFPGIDNNSYLFTTLSLTAGDRIIIWAYHNAGSPKNLYLAEIKIAFIGV